MISANLFIILWYKQEAETDVIWSFNERLVNNSKTVFKCVIQKQAKVRQSANINNVVESKIVEKDKLKQHTEIKA